MTRENLSGTLSDGSQLGGYLDIDFTNLTLSGSVTVEGGVYTPGRTIDTMTDYVDTTFSISQSPDDVYNIEIARRSEVGPPIDYEPSTTFTASFIGTEPSSFTTGTFTTSQPQFHSTLPPLTYTATITSSKIAMACFASGTLICTLRGDVAVEALQVGDLVVTPTGELRPIRWLGHRRIDCRRHPRMNDVLPVRIAAHAFGEGRPSRDLVVSPGHALCLDIGGEVLIPALALVNGKTITRDVVDSVTYWHVELDGHDLLFAENLPTESYLEMGNRGFFFDATAVMLTAAPDASVKTHADFCRPFHACGSIVDAARLRLNARALVLQQQRAGVAPSRSASA